MAGVTKARILGWLIATVVRGIGLTLRFSLRDESGVTGKNPDSPLLWTFWHNRLFAVPLAWKRFMPQRYGTVLTSPSRDGELLAEAMRAFGAESMRGSSSKRGAPALIGLVDLVESGHDIAITPDGPRGPVCRLQPGVVKLSQKTGAPIFPIAVTYHRVWRLKSWDGFYVPKPFSRVDVVFKELQIIDDRPGEEFFESERLRIEELLLTEGDIADRAVKEAERRERKNKNKKKKKKKGKS